MVWSLIIIVKSLKERGKNMTSKQRAYLKSLAMNADTIMNIGKSSLTPEVCTAVSEALEKRELVKIGVLKTVSMIRRRSRL